MQIDWGDAERKLTDRVSVLEGASKEARAKVGSVHLAGHPRVESGFRIEGDVLFLSDPRTLDDMVNHRFIYRSHVIENMVEAVERRSAELHLARMLSRDELSELEPRSYRAS